MIKSLPLFMLLLFSFDAHAQRNIQVANASELRQWNEQAQPGDRVTIQAGIWKDETLVLTAKGTREKPIQVTASAPGGWVLKGTSRLEIAGSYLEVSGLMFTGGYAGDRPVIQFKSGKKLAMHCVLKDAAIIDYNNPLRMQENYWVALHGQYNVIEYCRFEGKKNMGVLMAVILEEAESRENHHQIRNNYFGTRIPLASNTGEIIRVGVSQHAQYSSYTEIKNNYFDQCDGETEIVSIKSGRNRIENNVFYACQGSVVLRHGDENTVYGNIFWGTGKRGTGGVRVINRGQWVVNNYFHGCRGIFFRSPLAVMNGIPNSPAHRYVQVTDAVIAQNSFVNCAPVTLCDGADAERTLPPDRVMLLGNSWYHSESKTDTLAMLVYDQIKGIQFQQNYTNRSLPADQNTYWIRSPYDLKNPGSPKVNDLATSNHDKLQQEAVARLGQPLRNRIGADPALASEARRKSIRQQAGTRWSVPPPPPPLRIEKRRAAHTAELLQALNRSGPVEITLTGNEYTFEQPILLNKSVLLRGNGQKIRFSSNSIACAFILSGKANLQIKQLHMDGTHFKGMDLIQSDSTAPVEHFQFSLENAVVENFQIRSLLRTPTHTVADSCIIRSTYFNNNAMLILKMDEEKEDKGYYNAEKIYFNQNRVEQHRGGLLSLYRGGNDESTMGPWLQVRQNQFSKIESTEPLFKLTGVQWSECKQNQFMQSGAPAQWIQYKDIVRAVHLQD
jgi:poly(beta-D-mannuronate) lyase